MPRTASSRGAVGPQRSARASSRAKNREASPPTSRNARRLPLSIPRSDRPMARIARSLACETLNCKSGLGCSGTSQGLPRVSWASCIDAALTPVYADRTLRSTEHVSTKRRPGIGAMSLALAISSSQSTAASPSGPSHSRSCSTDEGQFRGFPLAYRFRGLHWDTARPWRPMCSATSPT